MRRRWYHISLARKVSILFGTAVLLTIGVTLFFPWVHMSALNEHAMLLRAAHAASLAYREVDVRHPDWAGAQAELNRRWPLLAEDLDLPAEPPRLVFDGPGAGGGFQRDALQQLRGSPDQRYYWKIQDEGRIFRFAMAIRGAPADPHPTALKGIIDVQLQIPREPGFWNATVTVLAGATGCVLAILVFYLVTQRLVLSPLARLRRVAEQVTSGDMNVQAVIHSRDEFEELAEALNDMLLHLRNAQEEQERINRSLDIRLGELAETNVALFESNRVKSEFLANVTHELRTPLVSIIGFAELLRHAWDGSQVDRQRLARYTEHILENGRNLLTIINDLLDLAKIEAGRMELHVTEFAPQDLCRDLIDFVRPLADKRNQQLSLSLTDDLPRCRTDSGKITQILYNLLSNAIKFTPTGGAVRLSVERNGRHELRLTVRDTGPGIPDDLQPVIFEQFRQLDASRTREHPGTGLGLTITRELVQMLGGRIFVESEQGRGSTFIVELPAVLRDASAAPAQVRLV